MSRNPVVFHSTLASDAVADALLRSIDIEGVPQYMAPWFIRLFRQGGSRPVCGVVQSNTFRLKRRNGGQYAPNVYAKWEPEHGGTRIEGYFELAPLVRLSVRFSVIVVLALWLIGRSLNVLDLTAETHFTKDPDVGLVICVLFVPFTIGFYLVTRRLGFRPDESLLAFLELTLAASRVGELGLNPHIPD